jgi:hypothetical protein
MEESEEFRVTRHKGQGPESKDTRVIFHHLDEEPAQRFYDETPPKPGYAIALWHPDGGLIAFTSASRIPAGKP